LCLTVLLTVRAGTEEQAHRCLRALAEETRREPGCLAYNAHHAADNPRRLLIYELYRDEAGLEAHRQSAHFARYATGELYTLVEERVPEFFAPVAVA
jgi:quinol monooxygenase YgiN